MKRLFAIVLFFFQFLGGFQVALSLGSDSENTPRIVYTSETIQAAILSGDWLKIGQDAGKIAGLEPDDLFPNRLRRTFDLMLGNAIGSKYVGAKAAGIILSYYTPFILDAERDMLTGVADAFHVTPAYMQKAFVIGESLNFLILKINAISRFISACSSFAVKDQGGKLLVGHNMDFAGAGTFDKNLAVYLLKPPTGYRILAISPRGIPLAGLTAMNEKGLSIALHTGIHQIIASKNVAPLLSVNREILEKASTIREALTVYRKYNYMTGWLVQIADKNEAGMIEFSGQGIRFLPANSAGISTLTNNYLTKNNFSREFRLSKGIDIHNRDRFKRLRALAQKQFISSSNEESLQRAFGILSDSYSPYSKKKVILSPSSIRAVDQVFSVVFDPQERVIWVADNALAPSSLAKRYVKFGFENMEAAHFKYESIENIYSEILPGLSAPQKEKAERALKEFILAGVEEEQRGNSLKAYRHLFEAARLSPDCSFDLFLGAHALYFSSLYDHTHDHSKNQVYDEFTENLAVAVENLDKATQCKALSNHHHAIANYLLGLTYQLNRAFANAVRSFDEAERLELLAVTEFDDLRPKPSLLTQIRRYRSLALKKKYRLGPLNVKLDFKFADQIMGW